MDIVRAFFASLKLTGTFQIIGLDYKHILVRLSSPADFNRIRLRGTYSVRGKPLRVWKWEVGFRIGHESSLTPAWVSFPGLPFEFWGGLKSFASRFGTPIQCDRPTLNFSRSSMARVLVEFDAKKSYPEEICISVDGIPTYWQRVEIENRPWYCDFCHKLGHQDHECYVHHPELRPARQGIPSQAKRASGGGPQAPLTTVPVPVTREVPFESDDLLGDLLVVDPPQAPTTEVADAQRPEEVGGNLDALLGSLDLPTSLLLQNQGNNCDHSLSDLPHSFEEAPTSEPPLTSVTLQAPSPTILVDRDAPLVGHDRLADLPEVIYLRPQPLWRL
ncbi:hypothetical protein AXF42_Ash021384 [Apostasia shenzhenica]|uniref:Uncharacterized protein n=1 Tax=Apostasia shenzhenica TaxID=1088818 RepID=A0A2H9ZZW9_9ASPA|nr:hypothetical protein AXF42_Ash021384 [Apostasia shenzhenica]